MPSPLVQTSWNLNCPDLKCDVEVTKGRRVHDAGMRDVCQRPWIGTTILLSYILWGMIMREHAIIDFRSEALQESIHTYHRRPRSTAGGMKELGRLTCTLRPLAATTVTDKTWIADSNDESD